MAHCQSNTEDFALSSGQSINNNVVSLYKPRAAKIIACLIILSCLLTSFHQYELYSQLLDRNFLLEILSLCLAGMIMAQIFIPRWLSRGSRNMICSAVICVVSTSSYWIPWHLQQQEYANQHDRYCSALDSVLFEFDYDVEKEKNPSELFTAEVYGDWSESLKDAHTFQSAMSKKDDEFCELIFELVERGPYCEMLVDEGYRSDCRKAYTDIAGRLATFHDEVEKIYDGFEHKWIVEDKLTPDSVAEYLISTKEERHARTNKVTLIGSKLCATVVQIVNILDEQAGFFWWDNGLYFLDFGKQEQFSSLFAQLYALFNELYDEVR